MKIMISKEQIPIYMFYLSQLGLISSLYGAATGNAVIISIGVWSIFISIIGIVYVGIKQYRIISNEVLAIFVIIVISILSMILSGWFSYQCFVSLFSFLEIPIFIVFTKPIIDDKRIKATGVFAILTTVLYIYLYYSPRAHLFNTIYGERFISDLTLGFSNPNETGMHLLATFFVLVTCIFAFKKRIVRLLFIFCSIIVFYFIILTLSRACLLIAVLFLVLLFPILTKKNIPIFLQVLCLCSPIITFIITAIFTEFFATRYLFGEVLDTGRILIYLTRVNGLSVSQILFGNYKYLFQNSLNAYVSIYITIGFPALLVYLKIMFSGIKSCYACVQKNYNYVAMLGILMIFVHASMESASLVSGSYYAAAFFGIFVLAID